MDLWGLISQVVNVPGMLAGIGVAVLYLYAAPGPLDAEGKKSFLIHPGTIWARIQPFVGPTAAFLSTMAVEWYQTHPEIGGAIGVIPADVVRGITTAFGCEYSFRIYYKTFRGV